MRQVAIIGAGMVQFGKFPQSRIEEFGRDACVAAIKDAGIDRRLIQAAYCGHVMQGMAAGQRVFREVGLAGISITNVENVCASGSTALHHAYNAVALGLCDVTIALGVEQMSRTIEGFIPQGDENIEFAFGLSIPAKFAMSARSHMEKYGTTLEQIAGVSVKNHRNGCLNPYAQYRQQYTVEEVLSSRPICEPLTLLQCSPTGDGAAAVILCSAEVAKQFTTRPVLVASSILKSGTYAGGFRDLTEYDLTHRTVREAYEKAGLGPQDVDVVELHDGFTVAEIIHSEDLGLCAKGEGGRLIEEGATEIGGRIPINPSGGLLSRGHPLGATGVAQVVELVWQLRQQAGGRQVQGARVGLAHCMGGGVVNLDCAACTVHLLKV